MLSLPIHIYAGTVYEEESSGSYSLLRVAVVEAKFLAAASDDMVGAAEVSRGLECQMDFGPNRAILLELPSIQE